MRDKAPFEITHFESLLRKSDGDLTGLASFFNSAEILLARVPARLDVIGGIADYSGSNVCEGVLGCGMAIALQPRTDRTLRIRTIQALKSSLPVETRIPLTYFESAEGFVPYSDIGDLCRSNPLSSWVAYIGGSIFTLLKEENIKLQYGFNLLLISGAPMNVGIGSSAATEIAVVSCLNAYLNLNLKESRIAKLGQIAENFVVGAPCGAMDQIAVTSGRKNKLTHIICQPGSVVGEVDIPKGTSFVGINSMVKHSVAGAGYTDVRIGAFMGKAIINKIREKEGKAPLKYLADLTIDSFEKFYESELPESMLGSEFIDQYGNHGDSITTVQPDATYRIVGPTRHPVFENRRVIAFMECLRNGDEQSRVKAGEIMFACHESYKANCSLSVPEVDFIVEEVRKRGPSKGLYGAKITGGGSGGTIAVYGTQEALAEEIPIICQQYQRLTGTPPDRFEGTSSGAAEFGAIHYSFGPNGWSRSV